MIKTTAVVVSSALAAVAGSLYAFYLSFINVESFVLETSMQLMAMVIIGGTATLLGPVIGAVLILLLPAGLSYICRICRRPRSARSSRSSTAWRWCC